MTGKVHLHRDGAIATVVIDNERRLNALSRPMWEGLGNAFGKLSADDTVRCVVLRGAGEAFASGADISVFETERKDIESARRYSATTHGAMDAIGACPHPVVALIKGPCIGGGFEIATRCDVRICGESSRLGIPARNLGLVVGYGEMQALMNVVGYATALEILFEGRFFGAAEALQKGMVTRVVPDADVEKEAYATAQRIAAGAPLSARWHKKFAKRLLDPRPLTAAEREEEFACFGSEDYNIGYRAFLEKKKPEFKGR
jgi:enoyl-CoA hydratase/carnithine racemase